MTDDSLHLVVAKDPCYPGCYYYTDSCFRNDCKHRVAQMKSESEGVCPPATSLNNTQTKETNVPNQ